MRRSPFLAILIASLTTAPSLAGAQEPPPLAGLFPQRAPIDVPADGLVRLALPVEVIAAARPDLSDVRIFDADGEEVPYLVDRGDRPLPDVENETTPAGTVLPIDLARQRERVPGGISRSRESLVVESPGTPPDGAHWVLSIDSARPSFVATVHVLALADDGTERAVATGSFYRLTMPSRERLELALPGIATHPGERLRIELTTEDGYVEPALTLTAHRAAAHPPSATVPLAITAQRRERGRTILVIDRPPGIVPERLAIATSTASFLRAIDVVAIDVDRGRRPIGAGYVFRVEGVPGAEELDLAVLPASGGRLEIAIDDGDSPPLAAPSVLAIVRRPSLVFEGRSASMLRFGGGRVRPPRYDLQSLFGTRAFEELTGRLEGTAALGPIERDPDFDPRPALDFAMRPGAALDLSRHRSVAPLTIATTLEGLSRVTLGADVLAAARTDRRDLRVIDETGRPWPHLLAPATAPIEIMLAPGPATADPRPGWSRHELRAPVERIAAQTIRIDTAATFVDRDVEVCGIAPDGDEITLGYASLVRRPSIEGDLIVSLTGDRVATLFLRVHDGDEQPLTIDGVRAELATDDLYVTAPAGAYRVLAGDDDARAADYEIARARALVLAVEAEPASLGPIAPSPAYRPPGALERITTDVAIVWSVLILAVLVLGVLTLRVARHAPSPEEEATTAES
jgi:hypothetical protein